MVAREIEVDVYVAYWDEPYNGSSEPIAVFFSEAEAEAWRLGQCLPDSYSDYTPGWVRLEGNGCEGCRGECDYCMAHRLDNS